MGIFTLTITIYINHLIPLPPAVDNLGMEGANIGVNERRPSAAVPPAWLEPKSQPYTNVFVAGAAAAGQSGMRSPTNVQATATAEAKAIEEGYRQNIPPKIMINDPHDRNYILAVGPICERQWICNCSLLWILFSDCIIVAIPAACSLFALVIFFHAQIG